MNKNCVSWENIKIRFWYDTFWLFSIYEISKICIWPYKGIYSSKNNYYMWIRGQAHFLLRIVNTKYKQNAPIHCQAMILGRSYCWNMCSSLEWYVRFTFVFSIFLMHKLLCYGNIITIELYNPTNWKLNEILNLKWFPDSNSYYIAVLLCSIFLNKTSHHRK